MGEADIKSIYKKVTLSAKVSIGHRGGELASDEEWNAALVHVLDDWNDGRYPFSVEMLHEGLCRVLSAALGKAVQDHMYRVAPNKVAQDGASYSCKLASMRMRRLEWVSIHGGTFELAKIEDAGDD